MQAEHKDSYKQIVKATSIFGGVQVIQILISVIRSKFVAILLGPAGVGINGLFISTVGLITGFTNFGLGTSAVKHIAHSFGTGNEQKVAKTVTVLRRLVWITGLLGFTVTLCFSSLLSKVTFGNSNYTWAFVWLSITLLINQISVGQGVFLQGIRRINDMAKSSVIGSFFGLFTSLPLYYFYGIEGIVPALIITSITTLLLTSYYSSKVPLQRVDVTREDILTEGKSMMKLGLMLTLSNIISSATAYFLRAYISNVGSVEQVGLFAAGFTVINTYVGMIFTAMSTDYYPRLSSISDDREKRTKLINQQGEIILLILGPVLSVFIIFGTVIINILYSNKFIVVSEMMQWAALGIYFKAASWPIGYIILAKGHAKAFFWNELAVNVYGLFFNIIGYYLLGLTGLGISFLLMYVCHFMQIYLVAKKYYAFNFEKKTLKILVIQLGLGLFCFLILKTAPSPYQYIFGLIPILISIRVSYKTIDSIFGLTEKVKKFRKNKNE